MAFLKNSMVAGDLRVTGTIFGDANLSSINANNTGLGTEGQILTSTGTGLAWSSSVAPSSHTHGNITNAGELGTANAAVVTDSNKKITTRTIKNMTAKSDLGWTASGTDTYIPTVNTLAYWNGRYNSTNSNLEYCSKGAFGAAVTYAVDDATANGALGTSQGLTTERSVYYGLVTVNNASQTRATGIYAPTSAGTANQILVSAGGTSAPTWKATANGAAYATGNNSALTFGTLPIAQGGTGATSAAGIRSAIEDGNYLSCSTGASTAAKTIALTDFVLKTGIIVNVVFTAQNTAATPTLNINGTGAKNIYCKGTQVKSYGLKANTIYRLLYDGTQWQVINDIIPDFGFCTTAVGTVAKTANIAGFVPYTGATVYIKFTKNNSALTPTLNINGYGAAPIRNKNTTSGTMYYAFRTDQYYGFVYNGTEYILINHVIQEAVTLGVTAVAAQTDPDTGDIITPAVAEVHGSDILYLGNVTNSKTDNGLTGKLALYNAGTKCIIISAEANTATSDRTWYLPNLNSNRYFITHSSASALGSNTKPIKIDANGAVSEASTYAGGTKVTLNNSDKGATTASFYAPTAGGSSGQFLVAVGSTSAPNWKTLSSHTYTPAGSVSVSTSTTENKTATVSTTSGTATYTPGGTNSAPAFTGTAATIVVNGGTGTATYTPAGTIAVNGTTSTATVIKTATFNTVVTSATVANEILTISTGTAGSSTNQTGVRIADPAYKFTGTGTRLTASYTPAGSVAAPTFTGTGVRLVTGDIAVPKTYSASFTGTEATLSHTVS